MLVERVADGVALGGQAPPSVSWRPQVSATTVQSGCPRVPSRRDGGQAEVALGANRVGGAVAVARVVGSEEQRVHRLVALQVDDAQRLAALDPHPPAVAGGDHVVVAGALGRQRALHQGSQESTARC